MMKNRAILIAACTLLVLSSACSPESFPVGDYKPAASNTTAMTVSLNFAPDGTFASATYSGLKLAGTYSVSGDKITLNASKDGPCFGSPMTMAWASSGTSLTLKTFEDKCSEAISYDLAGEWTRQP